MLNVTLRPYQNDLKAGIYADWQAGHRNVLAVSPTGSGKAMTLCTLAHELAYVYGMPTTIKVHRKELVSQLCGTLAQLGIPHNIIAQKSTILEIMAYEKFEYGKSYYDHRSPITVVSVDTLLSRADKYQDWCHRQRAWILDEAAHQLKDNKWGQVAALLPNAIGVGFTATPERLDKKGLGRHAFGLFDTMVMGPTVRWLIDNNFLSKFKVVVPKSDYRKHLEDTGDSTKDYTAKARNYASLHSHIIGDVVEKYIEFAYQKQTLVFADSIEAAQRMEETFKAKGIPAKLLTSDTPAKERTQGVRDFAENKTWVLINVDLFDEGFDIPAKPGRRIIEAVILARPTKSKSKYLQMCGRALRVSPNKEYGIIIDHVGNVSYHGLPDKLRSWTLDNIVKRKQTVNLLRICTNVTCNIPFDRWLDACPACGNTDKPYTRRSSEQTAREALEVVDGDMELLDPETIRELENEMNLEDPWEREKRVRLAAGDAAGISARKKQQERIDKQKDLVNLIAQWAGKQKHYGLNDRAIKKKFHAVFDEGITVVLSLPTAEMKEYEILIKQDLGIL